MYPHSFWWHYLWIAPDILLLITAWMMLRLGLFREFPMFLSYAVFESLQGATLFILDHSSAISGVAYWNAHWAGMLVSIVLRFAVIHEIFASVFRPYPALIGFSRLLIRWTTVLLLFAAVILTASAAMDTPFLLSGVHLLNRAVGLVQSGLLVLLFIFCAYFRLSWRAYTYGIAMGLGIFASVDLATAALRVWLGTPAAGSYVFDFVTMTTYHCCVLIWLVYMLVPEAASQSVQDVPDHNLEQWSAEMQRLLSR